MKCVKRLLPLFGLIASSAALADNHSHHSLDHCIEAISQARSGAIIKLESLNHNGKTLLEFEVLDKNGFEWEAMCDPATGKVFEWETEASSPASSRFNAKIPEDDALLIALKAHPGIVEEVEYEIEEDGSPTYEIDIAGDDGVEHKIEVDAVTGKIIEAYTENWEIGVEAQERR
jgi:uncharacterized membrane protein YkoI